ncbi:hypothetical protein SELMODRAFT_179057 [Selaginella moellendorffii]|uniref:Oligopeptide transporter n=1 Tax=Selaginella moellendorffii TaxID=88036 RepID=D8SEN2_SELML|nr:oligopeptide transporter 4 [Selaginella moellendorffii]EFJ17229.1 hypothetical protein SELMODRAFT_179057 [Selaginella moellendorffii]|eukprot:XP_002981747.1 oligopeptide transporter 4 [Selaginella moellendorffii]
MEAEKEARDLHDGKENSQAGGEDQDHQVGEEPKLKDESLDQGGSEKEEVGEKEEQSPIEEVALTVDTSDDPSLPVYTFRMWTLGVVSCVLLAFFNQFFAYRTEPLIITAISAQIVTLPLGKLMAATLPTRKFSIFGREFSLNPGAFNKKEHVLITIFANTGAGSAYAVGIVTIVKAFYKRRMDFGVGLLITITTQIIGYGWAGIFRKYLVDPAEMWWPSNLVQVSIFRTLHEKDVRRKGGLTRLQFFLIALTFSFCYYTFPDYWFISLSSLSWVCYAWPKSVTAQQIGSGFYGLGLGSIAFDWAAIASYLGSPLASPWFATANVMVGFSLFMYVVTPLTYWSNLYGAKRFPIFSSGLYADDGSEYNFTRVIKDHSLQLDYDAYNSYSKLHLSNFFVFTYGASFAALTATLAHVAIFHGKEIYSMTTSALTSRKVDVHTRLMMRYKTVPQFWFLGMMFASMALAIFTCEYFNSTVQLRWWGLLFAFGIAFIFTMPIAIIAATTNQVPGLNVITEYLIGYVYPNRPVANVLFKTYGYISMTQAVSFLSDFKLGHYMKIPPRSMFTVQVLGTVIAATVNLSTAWWLLSSIKGICHPSELPRNSPWTCPNDTVFFDASVIWGLIGPMRMWGSLGQYNQMNWFFLVGAVAPVFVWIAIKLFPKQRWLRLVNMPILLGATGAIPPATAVNYWSWFLMGFVFNYLIFRYKKAWWQRHNYVLSAALDAGVAFMAILVYFATRMGDYSVNWWGATIDNCPLAACPTQPGIVPFVKSCPVP